MRYDEKGESKHNYSFTCYLGNNPIPLFRQELTINVNYMPMIPHENIKCKQFFSKQHSEIVYTTPTIHSIQYIIYHFLRKVKFFLCDSPLICYDSLLTYFLSVYM